MTTGGEVEVDSFCAGSIVGLRRLAFARTGSWPVAEDLVQDAMADAHHRWTEVGQFDNPAAWVRRAVLNRSISVHRRRGRERRALERVVAGTISTSEPPGLADEDLWVAIRALSPRQLEVVLLLWFEDLAVAEVATTLGCGEESVRTHWRRARQHLADALGEADDDPAPERAGGGEAR